MRDEGELEKLGRQPDMLKLKMMPVLGEQPIVFLWIDERQFYLSKVLGSAVAGDRLVQANYETVMSETVAIWERTYPPAPSLKGKGV
jgi:hypothetical protein